MSSIFNKYLKNGDEIISVLVENIEKIKTKMILEQEFYVIDYLII